MGNLTSVILNGARYTWALTLSDLLPGAVMKNKSEGLVESCAPPECLFTGSFVCAQWAVALINDAKHPSNESGVF
jgi:hypothetical protein